METQQLHRGRLIDHIQLVVRDLPAAERFYTAIAEVLNIPVGGSGDGFCLGHGHLIRALNCGRMIFLPWAVIAVTSARWEGLARYVRRWQGEGQGAILISCNVGIAPGETLWKPSNCTVAD